ncbi:Uncharacterised protein [Vibrio cholerae]|nr:Uncharacterised protein [Vibrio cholerae]
MRYKSLGAIFEVATNTIPRLNKASNRVPRIIASVISETKNSSKQIMFASAQKRSATISSGSLTSDKVRNSSCTRYIKR